MANKYSIPAALSGGQHEGTLIAVLGLVGIVAVIAAAVSAQSTSQIEANASLNLAADREALVQMVSAAVDCDKTLAAYTPVTICPAQLRLLDINGKTVVAGTAAGTAVGKWSVRANCDSSGITLQAARYAAGQKGFHFDPLTKLALDWNHPQATLLPPATGICAAAFNKPQAKGLIFGGFIYRCPYNAAGASPVAVSFGQARVDTSMPFNMYSGTTQCPSGFTPRLSWAYFSADCGQTTFCNCGYVTAKPSQNACTIASTGGTTGMAGCGQLQYMCVRQSDGSPVPDDGSGLN